MLTPHEFWQLWDAKYKRTMIERGESYDKPRPFDAAETAEFERYIEERRACRTKTI